MHLYVPTDKEIRALVGATSYERAIEYAEGGKVAAVRLRGRELSARVQGSARTPYQVEIDLGETGIDRSWCSCPVGAGGVCKHVGALLMHWQDEADAPSPSAYGQAGGPGARRPSRLERREEADEGPGGLTTRMSVAQVMEWAAAHGVTRWA